MPIDNAQRGDELVIEIDEALAKCPALTKQQLDDVGSMRTRLMKLSRTGDLAEAKRCQELALAMIRSGAPASE
jgi:hypothetical protein